MDNQPRERLGSRLGFILLSVGCAVGMGNVWKFPTITGQNGGAFFVLFYLLFLVLLGVPLMTMEFALGRAAQKSPVRLYHALTPKGSPFRAHGYAAFAGNIILMMFYVPVCAWTIVYFFYALTGKFQTTAITEFGALFDGMIGNPLALTLVVLGVTALGFFVCSRSLQGGLERVTKIMMVALFAIMVALAVNSFTLDGAKEGLSFYLLPSVENFLDPSHNGIIGVITAAMNQAFFTLSIGIGSMAIFGSFIGKDRALLGESVRVTALDTLVALLAGLIIFPACATFGVEVSAGPPLIFIALPRIFHDMWGGQVFGTLFFVFMAFAALSTVFAVFQNILSCAQDLFGWSKKKTALVCGVGVFLLTLPCVFGGLSGLSLGKLTSVLDVEDYLVSNILLPLGALTFTVFCTWKRGWGFEHFMAEANTGKGLKVKRWMYGYMKYVLPVIIGALFVMGAINPFI